MRFLISHVLLVLCSVLSTQAQAPPTPSPDGQIVPFTSGLPACASLCGPLFDVQGKCTIGSVDDNCFCTDGRLTPFDTQGTAGVAAVCGAASCSSQSDLTAVKTWYDQFCKTNTGTTTTSAAPGATTTSSSSSGSGKGSGTKTTNGSWLSTHYKWVIMLVIIVVFIVGGWVIACMLRKRHIRKKEKQYEMRPPVAWGPHQMQGMSGGYNYGDGVHEASRGGKGKGKGVYANKEIAATTAPANVSKRDSKALKKSNRGS